MTRAAATFSACDVKRLVATARKAGLPVDRMGLVVEEGRITLLPPANDGAGTVAGSGGDWDRRLAK